MKNRFDIQKDLVFSDLPAKFHAWERSNSFKNEASSTLIDAFFLQFLTIFNEPVLEKSRSQKCQKSQRSRRSQRS